MKGKRASVDRRIIEDFFPIAEASKEAAREKSVRQGHASTLQYWWARRPHNVCRVAIAASLLPSSKEFNGRKDLRELLASIVPDGRDSDARLRGLLSKLSSVDATRDSTLIDGVQRLIAAARGRPTVLDSFAGGGTIPIEALRLGARVNAGDLNQVAAFLLETSVGLLPGRASAVRLYRTEMSGVAERVASRCAPLYGDAKASKTLAFFWARTFQCPECGGTAPLLRDFWLAKGKSPVVAIPSFRTSKRHLHFVVRAPASDAERAEASQATVTRKGAQCLHCKATTSLSVIQGQATAASGLGEMLYGVLEIGPDGKKLYRAATEADQSCIGAAAEMLRGRGEFDAPTDLLDINGVRHLWAIQYGVRRWRDLFSLRQRAAFSVVLEELTRLRNNWVRKSGAGELTDDQRACLNLMAMTLNRLVLYGSRHTWWQPTGEFPANLFARQAIPTVWNYVEIPLSSTGAGGMASAATWVAKAADSLVSLPSSARVWRGDAARTPLAKGSVDLAFIDPPYFDSIAYSFLSDAFYVWLKRLLEPVQPELFSDDLTEKRAEAVVDRKHSLANHVRTGAHFAGKMREAFEEIRRVLKDDGLFVVMYGHKEVAAWEALLEPLVSAGFTPSVSWPVQMERKVKFEHSKVDALATSVILVCRPIKSTRPSKLPRAVSFRDFLHQRLDELIEDYSVAGVTGSDLYAALIGPSVALYVAYREQAKREGLPSMAALFSEIREITASAEVRAVLSRAGRSERTNLVAVSKRELPAKAGRPKALSLIDALRPHAGRAAKDVMTYAGLLNDRDLAGADEFATSLASDRSAEMVRLMRLVASTCSPSPAASACRRCISRLGTRFGSGRARPRHR